MNLNQVTLPVTDMRRAVEFYRHLGFTLIVDTPHYARFECPDGGAATFSLSLSEASFNSGTVIYFEEEHLDDWVDRLVAKGVEFEQMPMDMSYLWREAVLKDPDGNMIKLYWAGENRRFPPWRVVDTSAPQ
jgi:catechol 2,3-dioxygenase-like lactoylglutathione lyase family enzyme